MHQVTNNLYLGNYMDAKDIIALKSNSISTIICVAHECNFFPGISYDKFGIHRLLFNVKSKSCDDMEKNLEYVYRAISAAVSFGNRVLIHCVNGKHRSPTFVIYYLMKKNMWTLEEAYTYLKDIRTCIEPSDEFLKLLIQ